MDTNQPIDQLSKKEKRELKRQEKLERRENATKKERPRRIMYWAIGIVSGSLLIYVFIFATTKKPAPLLGVAIPIQGQQHIAVGASHAEYNSNPPTSGPHYEQPANWGVYQNELPDEQLIHNLEHGGIWISYKNIDEPTKVALEKITRTHSKVIIAPRAKNDVSIAIASWGQVLKLQIYDERQVSDFIKTNSNRSPEPLAQ